MTVQRPDDADSDPGALYQKGVAYRELGLLREAIVVLRPAAEDPEYALRASEVLGDCHRDLAEHEAAARRFIQALALAERGSATYLRIRHKLSSLPGDEAGGGTFGE
jgi:tetratricopeptide (TPR) repeat protein